MEGYITAVGTGGLGPVAGDGVDWGHFPMAISLVRHVGDLWWEAQMF